MEEFYVQRSFPGPGLLGWKRHELWNLGVRNWVRWQAGFSVYARLVWGSLYFRILQEHKARQAR